MSRIAVITLIILSGTSVLAAPQKTAIPKAPRLSIDQLMTAAEFRTAGLQKLTPEELQTLNSWLTKHSAALLARAAESRPVASAPASSDVIESHIDGNFEGWDGETIFKLDNGQIWQQASYSYTYHYAYHPKVIVYRSGGGYKMKVEGMDDALPVKRLK